ncbi:MAG: DUF4270 domain-containing protein [Flavobacteriales bacterium]|jgi:hypothetical protein|nr:DUF4270 domain-containing protein [Flavobacteriales bacterium]
MKFWPTKAATIFILLITFFSCKKKENDLGLAIQPQDEELDLGISDTTKLITYIGESDSIPTDELSGDNLLGSYIDPFFGEVDAAIFAQLRISSAVDFTPASGDLNDLVVDSVRLYLKISNLYGNQQAQNFEVYRLNSTLDQDSTYYSTTTIDSIQGNLVSAGMGSISPNPYTLGTVEGETVEEPILAIPLDENLFGWDIINQSGTGVLEGNDGSGQFVEWFKGLLIKTNTTQNVNEGGIIYTDLLNEYSKITIFYRDTVAQDTIAYDLNFNSQSARFHRVRMNNNGFYVGNELADSTLGQTQFFTQTLGGVHGKLFFPHLEDYVKEKKVIVNKAELVLPAQYYALDKYLPSSQLYLSRLDEDGSDIFVEDFVEDFGGTYDFENNQYVFNITRHINQVFSGAIANTPLKILPNQSGISANRVVFNGQSTTLKDKPKLKLTFTNY